MIVLALAVGAAGAPQVQINPVAGQGADQIGQQAVRDGNIPLLLNHGPNPGGDGDFQIGGRELEHPLVAAQQHVLGDGQGGAAGDGAANGGQTTGQILLKARKFHS